MLTIALCELILPLSCLGEIMATPLNIYNHFTTQIKWMMDRIMNYYSEIMILLKYKVYNVLDMSGFD